MKAIMIWRCTQWDLLLGQMKYGSERDECRKNPFILLFDLSNRVNGAAIY